MTELTMRLAHSHASANCSSVRPVFCACSRSFCAMANDSSRSSVSRDALVAARAARAFGQRRARRVLAGQHAARHRRVGRDAEAVVVARRQHLDLGHAVQQVVVRLADDGRRHALRLAFRHDFGDAPAAIVRHAEVADLAGAQELADARRRSRAIGVSGSSLCR